MSEQANTGCVEVSMWTEKGKLIITLESNIKVSPQNVIDAISEYLLINGVDYGVNNLEELDS